MAENQWVLNPHPTISPATRNAPLLVVVLDGWGEAPDAPDNAIALVTVIFVNYTERSLPNFTHSQTHNAQ